MVVALRIAAAVAVEECAEMLLGFLIVKAALLVGFSELDARVCVDEFDESTIVAEQRKLIFISVGTISTIRVKIGSDVIGGAKAKLLKQADKQRAVTGRFADERRAGVIETSRIVGGNMRAQQLLVVAWRLQRLQIKTHQLIGCVEIFGCKKLIGFDDQLKLLVVTHDPPLC